MKDGLRNVRADEKNKKWVQMIKREHTLYNRNNDIRTEFERDYTRMIHSNAFRRLKHKTQVFFSPSSDHICTRIEHINHVESISYTIANYLGLNTMLTKAIAVSHDIGHAPFGHKGESILNSILERENKESFWHEKNGLYFVDKIELLEDENGHRHSLDLTYAVRDGIISHCGEIDENSIRPRDIAIDLQEYIRPNQYSPFTWEACVVKIADKISYIGRDIEDALELGILNKEEILELDKILNRRQIINNANIINELVSDLCLNSSEENGLTFSKDKLRMMDEIKKFNYENIYLCDRIKPSNKYFELVLNQIFEIFIDSFEKQKFEKYKIIYKEIFEKFEQWLNKYTIEKENLVFERNNKQDYVRAVVTYIAGMTDNYAIKCYNDILTF